MDWTPFAVSLNLGLWVTGLLLAAGLPLAWVFARSRKLWVQALESFLSLPMVLAPTVVGYYLLVVLSPFSPLGSWLNQTWGIRLVFTFEGLVIASTVSSLPYMLTGLKSAMAGFPQSQLEASYTLGKGHLETFFRIVLPQILPGVLSGIIMTFAHTLGEFGVVLMIGGSLPGVTKVVSIAIFERVESLDFAGANVYALILVAIAYPAVFLLNRLQRRGGEK